MVFKWLQRKRKPADSNQELQRELSAMGSSLKLDGRRVTNKNRSSTVYLNYIDFYENGIKWLGIQGVSDTHEMAQLLICWNEKCMCSHEIEELFPEVAFPVARKMIEHGEEAYLNWFWKKLVEKRDKRFGPLIALCASNKRTRRLMSFVQLRDFGLSRSIGTINGVELNDLPRIRITDDWEFEVRTPSMAIQEYCGKQPREYIGRGNANQAFRLLLDLLPADCGTAYYQRGNGCCPPAA